jgi:acetoin utilization protein AcuC
LARQRTGIQPPELMTDGATADFVPYESGSNPHDPVDRAIAATMKAVFPSHGLLAGPW